MMFTQRRKALLTGLIGLLAMFSIAREFESFPRGLLLVLASWIAVRMALYLVDTVVLYMEHWHELMQVKLDKLKKEIEAAKRKESSGE